MNNYDDKIKELHLGGLPQQINVSHCENVSILFNEGYTTLTGKNNIPDMLLTTINFNRDNLPEHLKKELHLIRQLHVSVNLSYRFNNRQEYFSLPKWVGEFDKLEFLGLSNFRISDLSFLTTKSIKVLQLTNVEIDEVDNTIVDILSFNSLELIIYDSSCNKLINNLGKFDHKILKFQDYRSILYS